MKIYNVVKVPQGLGYDDVDYEALYQSGYTAGYASGYTDGYEDGYKECPLTFDIISGGTIYWSLWYPEEAEPLTIMYKKNDEEWVSITSTTGGTPIDVKAGDTLKFRGNNISYAGNRFGSDDDCRFSIRGNIMSLIDTSSYPTLTSVSRSAFYALFQNFPYTPGTQGLCDASNLLLPATTLANGCYRDMFYCCEGLTAAPKLPATTLTEGCYQGMFSNCTSLTSAPELPATKLATNCYYQMFEFCTSLTTAPELPVTTLANGCYSSMFSNCTSLTSAPELPATTLVEGCYSFMFSDCTSLNYIKCLATDIPASYCTSYWVKNVSSTGTFVKHPNATWSRGESGIPTNWTVKEE